MALTVAEFATRWKINSQSERASAQSHFIDLCDMLGEPHPAASDSVGERYAFEKPVNKTDGTKGYADVWLRDHFAWEYKGKHKDLQKAYKQLNDYREDLGNPPLLVVCDLDRFEVHTNFNTRPRIYAFNLDDLNHNHVTATCPPTARCAARPFRRLQRAATGTHRRPGHTGGRQTLQPSRGAS